MIVIDLAHTMNEAIPVYPGTPRPMIRDATTIESGGFAEKLISISTHTGTHIDAPAHIIPGSLTIDLIPVTRFLGPATVIGVEPRDAHIHKDVLLPYAGVIRESEFVLLHTGWSKHWGTEEYFADFPVLSDDAALWLASFQLKGIGIDAISVDPVDALDLRNHKRMLSRGTLIIENLTNLESLPAKGFLFVCMPWKLQGGDGSPVRAYAMIQEAPAAE